MIVVFYYLIPVDTGFLEMNRVLAGEVTLSRLSKKSRCREKTVKWCWMACCPHSNAVCTTAYTCFIFYLFIFFGVGAYQWETRIWSCDLRANERPKNSRPKQTSWLLDQLFVKQATPSEYLARTPCFVMRWPSEMTQEGSGGSGWQMRSFLL